jgi:hypothetical protein
VQKAQVPQQAKWSKHWHITHHKIYKWTLSVTAFRPIEHMSNWHTQFSHTMTQCAHTTQREISKKLSALQHVSSYKNTTCQLAHDSRTPHNIFLPSLLIHRSVLSKTALSQRVKSDMNRIEQNRMDYKNGWAGTVVFYALRPYLIVCAALSSCIQQVRTLNKVQYPAER